MLRQGSIFYDLGSGTGKAVFVARFLHDFGRCGGIEVLEGLAEAASEVQAAYDQGDYRSYLTVSGAGDCQLVQGSLLEDDWSDGDVCFANSTCFDDDLMEAMARRAEQLKPGAYFVTFTKGLPSPKFEVMERKRYKMSWGPATVYIHRRLNADGTSASSETLKDVPDDDEYDSPDEVSFASFPAPSTLVSNLIAFFGRTTTTTRARVRVRATMTMTRPLRTWTSDMGSQLKCTCAFLGSSREKRGPVPPSLLLIFLAWHRPASWCD